MKHYHAVPLDRASALRGAPVLCFTFAGTNVLSDRGAKWHGPSSAHAGLGDTRMNDYITPYQRRRPGLP